MRPARPSFSFARIVRSSCAGCAPPLPRRLIYLIDDDIQAAREDATLPEDYRSRLMRFHTEYHAELVARADTLVVTSDVLLQKFSSHRDVRIVHPVWHLDPADDRHFDALAGGAAVHAMHLGTASHQAGLDFLKPVVEALLERFASISFHLRGARRTPGSPGWASAGTPGEATILEALPENPGTAPRSSWPLSTARHAIQSRKIAEQTTGTRHSGCRGCLFALLANRRRIAGMRQFSLDQLQRTGSRLCRPTWKSRKGCAPSRRQRDG